MSHNLLTKRKTDLGDVLEDAGSVEVYRSTAMPFFMYLVKVELHEVPGHGCEHHVTLHAIDSVVEAPVGVVW